jgi:hypothetical protein
MAQFHISKDPPNKTPIAFSHTSFFGNQARITFRFRVVIFRNYFSNCTRIDQGIGGKKNYLNHESEQA